MTARARVLSFGTPTQPAPGVSYGTSVMVIVIDLTNNSPTPMVSPFGGSQVAVQPYVGARWPDLSSDDLSASAADAFGVAAPWDYEPVHHATSDPASPVVIDPGHSARFVAAETLPPGNPIRVQAEVSVTDADQATDTSGDVRPAAGPPGEAGANPVRVLTFTGTTPDPSVSPDLVSYGVADDGPPDPAAHGADGGGHD